MTDGERRRRLRQVYVLLCRLESGTALTPPPDRASAVSAAGGDAQGQPRFIITETGLAVKITEGRDG
jgi:hypothetical protein